ncbi:hypothetical protein A3844_02875 [Paenibacillus helianthi]|uniref:Uncharacterized protein n=1 Tax=Paenibacillus helianthi TaxID=1349432 RepID=A0ABX3EV31_9BACL|nr:hypothetical protein [Paenibacillus helianthi]OKP92071.1 hypothetical protein A3844_02875 [Paenibacillus helianthi]
MKKIKLLIVFLLIFASLPVTGAFAAVTNTLYFKSMATNPGRSMVVWLDKGEFTGTIYFTDGTNQKISGNVHKTFNYTDTRQEVVNYIELEMPSDSKILNMYIAEQLNGSGTTLYSFKPDDYTLSPPTPTTPPEPSTPPTPSPTATTPPTPTPSASPIPTATPTPSATTTPSATPTATPLASATPKPTPTTTPEQPIDDRAILTITLVNGTEKEYDLPIAEVDAFLTWYDARDAGRGPGMYAIDKHTNNKGPFKKRKDYVVFDKILTYEVSEYTAGE